ncbi:MAG: hypothetical protein WC838_00600 [Candidatus Margulisiibacteriota bacterium]|jgi:spermidine synthase
MLISLFYGFFNICFQSLIIRELIAQFTSNELGYGIFIAFWLMSNALGSILSRFLFINKEERGLQIILLLLAVLTPALILWLKFFKFFLNIPIGILMPNTIVFVATLSVFLPVGLLTGIFFSLQSRSLKDININYLYEGLGFAAGGLIFSFIFISFFDSLQIGLILALISILLVLFYYKKMKALLVVMALVAGALLFTSPLWEAKINSFLWPGYQFVKSKEAISGRLTLVKKNNLSTLFLNNAPYAYSYDKAYSEETAYIPLMYLPPKPKVLVIGGSRNLFKELTKAHADITILQPDRSVLRLYPSVVDLTRFKIADGRNFLRKTRQKFDCIIINMPPPFNVMSNRFYTKEFFLLAKMHLQDDGIMALQLPIGENAQVLDLNKSINKTLHSVYPVVKAVRVSALHYLSAKDPALFDTPDDYLNKKLSSFDPEFFNYSVLASALDPLNQKILWESISYSRTTWNNSDQRPVCYYLGLTYAQTLLNSSLVGVFDYVKKNNFWLLLLILAMIVFSTLLTKYKELSLPLVIFFQSLVMVAWEILLIQYYQIEYGELYHHFPVLIGLFMLGLSAGAWWANKQEAGEQIKMFRYVIIASAAYSVLLALLVTFNFLILIPLWLLIAGLLTGSCFGLSVKMAAASEDNIKKVSANYYAADLLGGVLAPLVLSTFLIPLNGFVLTAVLLLVVTMRNVIALFLLKYLSFKGK